MITEVGNEQVLFVFLMSLTVVVWRHSMNSQLLTVHMGVVLHMCATSTEADDRIELNGACRAKLSN